jgi:hypothetical protein
LCFSSNLALCSSSESPKEIKQRRKHVGHADLRQDPDGQNHHARRGIEVITCSSPLSAPWRSLISLVSPRPTGRPPALTHRFLPSAQRHHREREAENPRQGGHPARPAAPDLRGQAARGRPHARRLQHPEGIHAAPGVASTRRPRYKNSLCQSWIVVLLNRCYFLCACHALVFLSLLFASFQCFQLSACLLVPPRQLAYLSFLSSSAASAVSLNLTVRVQLKMVASIITYFLQPRAKVARATAKATRTTRAVRLSTPLCCAHRSLSLPSVSSFCLLTPLTKLADNSGKDEKEAESGLYL